MRKISLFLASAALFCFSGCSNDDDNSVDHVEPVATRTEMLTSAPWMMTSSLQTEQGRTIDNFSAQAATAQDDIFQFLADGTVIRKEGATRITGNPDEVDRGTWVFENQEQELHVSMPSLPVDDQIVELSRSRLIIRNLNTTREVLTTFQAQ